MFLLRIFSLISLAILCHGAFEESAGLLAPDRALMECFEYKYNYWLVGFAYETKTVAFKDDCLRQCLTAEVEGNVTCRSAMHIPDDQECVLTNQNRQTMPELFMENDKQQTKFTVNYYENKCSENPIKG